MSSKETELYSTFSSFPSRSHIETVCQPRKGAKTCRYLALRGADWCCEKAGHLRGELDERVKADTMGAKGDNCEGTLGFIRDNQSLLVGNKTIYQERMPTLEETATFVGMEVKEEGVILKTTGDEGNLVLSETDIQIDIEPTGIRFSLRGLGSIAGELKVLFKG